jgi:hypothetical protein
MTPERSRKVPEIPYFIRKKQTNPKKNAIIAMLPPGNGIVPDPRREYRIIIRSFPDGRAGPERRL